MQKALPAFILTELHFNQHAESQILLGKSHSKIQKRILLWKWCLVLFSGSIVWWNQRLSVIQGYLLLSQTEWAQAKTRRRNMKSSTHCHNAAPNYDALVYRFFEKGKILNYISWMKLRVWRWKVSPQWGEKEKMGIYRKNESTGVNLWPGY